MFSADWTGCGSRRSRTTAHESTRHDLFERAAFASNDHCGRKPIDVIFDCWPASACSTTARIAPGRPSWSASPSNCCCSPLACRCCRRASTPDHAVATAARQRTASRPTADPTPCPQQTLDRLLNRLRRARRARHRTVPSSRIEARSLIARARAATLVPSASAPTLRS